MFTAVLSDWGCIFAITLAVDVVVVVVVVVVVTTDVACQQHHRFNLLTTATGVRAVVVCVNFTFQFLNNNTQCRTHTLNE